MSSVPIDSKPYRELTDPRCWIRLLRLTSWSVDEQIFCELDEFLLPSDSRTHELSMTVREVSSSIAPLYTAVSYTWGTASSADQEISLAGHPVKVRRNLYEFLKQIRASRDTNYFWIDALCINQDYVLEKNAQVAIMGNIFAKASALTVWLGISEDDSDYFMQSMENGEGETFVSSKGLKPAIISPRFVDSLLELCNRPYWRRIWVIQEFALATESDSPIETPNITINCGRHKVPYSIFYRFCDAVRNTYRKLVFEEKATHVENDRDVYDSELWPPITASGNCLENFLSSWMFKILTIRPYGTIFYPKPLGHLIQSFYECDCEDSRDKVYALLGIANDVQRAWDSGQQVLLPDYNKDPFDILLEVLRFCQRELVGFGEGVLVKILAPSEKEELEWKDRLLTTDFYQREAGVEEKYKERLDKFLAGESAVKAQVGTNVTQAENAIVGLDDTDQAAAVVRARVNPFLIANSTVYQRRKSNRT